MDRVLFQVLTDRTVRLWDAASGEELAVLKGHESSVSSVVFSPDGSRIVSGSGDNTVRIWDADSGEELALLRGHQSGVSSAVFSPDGSRIVSGSLDKTVRLWDAATWEKRATKGHKICGECGRMELVDFMYASSDNFLLYRMRCKKRTRSTCRRME